MMAVSITPAIGCPLASPVKCARAGFMANRGHNQPARVSEGCFRNTRGSSVNIPRIMRVEVDIIAKIMKETSPHPIVVLHE